MRMNTVENNSHATFKRTVMLLSLSTVLLLGGACRFVETVYHRTGTSLHGQSGAPFPASGECVTDAGKHKISIAGARGTTAVEDVLYEENNDYKQIAVYTFRKQNGERTEVKIEKSNLTVNGKSYGTLKDNDAVTIDGEKVLINSKEAPQIASK